MSGTGEDTVAWRCFSRDVVPFAAMFAVECAMVGSSTLYKAATLRGLNFYVSIFYTYVVSTLILFPFSIIFGRSRRLPSVKSPLFFKIFLLGLVRFVAVIAGCKGIEYSSPTLSSAISNHTPAFTFTLAVICRLHLLLFFAEISWVDVKSVCYYQSCYQVCNSNWFCFLGLLLKDGTGKVKELGHSG